MATFSAESVLDALAHVDTVLSADDFSSTPSLAVKSALDRLGSRSMVTYETIDREETALTPEAAGIAAEGSHEAKVFEAVRKAMDGLKIGDLPMCHPSPP